MDQYLLEVQVHLLVLADQYLLGVLVLQYLPEVLAVRQNLSILDHLSILYLLLVLVILSHLFRHVHQATPLVQQDRMDQEDLYVLLDHMVLLVLAALEARMVLVVQEVPVVLVALVDQIYKGYNFLRVLA